MIGKMEYVWIWLEWTRAPNTSATQILLFELMNEGNAKNIAGTCFGCSVCLLLDTQTHNK